MRISVLIPAYNAESTLGQAVRSAIGQDTLEPFEIVICDDGSSDGTWREIQSLADSYPQIRTLRNDGNQGISRTRNRLLDEAHGEWIAFLDADDAFMTNKLSACLAEAERTGADVVRHYLCYLKQEGEVTGSIRGADFLQGALIHRDAIGSMRFSRELAAGGDSQFFCALKRRSTWTYLAEHLTAVRITRGSVTEKYWLQKRLIEHWHSKFPDRIAPHGLKVYQEFMDGLPFPVSLNLKRKWLGQRYGRMGAGLLFEGRRPTALVYLAASAVLYPSYLFSRMASNASAKRAADVP